MMQWRYYAQTEHAMVGERVALVHAGHYRGYVVRVVDERWVQIKWDDNPPSNLAGYAEIGQVEFLT